MKTCVLVLFIIEMVNLEEKREDPPALWDHRTIPLSKGPHGKGFKVLKNLLNIH